MNKQRKRIIAWVIIASAVLGGIWFLYRIQSAPGEYDAFTQCLNDNGAVFYGTFWCPYCQNQKSMFGKSSRLLNYVECSTPDGRGQLPICKDKDIKGYPTWEFKDGSRLSGAIPLKTLGEKTNCTLPE